MLEFFNMGGHGFYIWMSYGVVAVMLGYNYVAPIRQYRKLIQNLTTFYKQTDDH